MVRSGDEKNRADKKRIWKKGEKTAGKKTGEKTGNLTYFFII
jgi:hypothetical protein